MFELAPISLWLEDLTALREHFESLRARGLTDLLDHFKGDPADVLRCAGLIRVELVNQRTLDMLGMPNIGVLRANLHNVFRDDMHDQYARELNELWCGRLSFTNQTTNYALDGRRIDIQLHGRILPGYEKTWARALFALEDISARKKAERHLAHLSTHDLMTQLRNRMFYDEEVMRLEANGPHPVAVISIDCNGLKPVNDMLGHAAGDALLRRLARLLRQAVPAGGSAARIGGDEFAAILPGADETAAVELAQTLGRLVQADNTLFPQSPLSFSIGWAVCHPGESIEAATRLADARMYANKRAYYATHDRRRNESKI
jgi:diguanylate cyclase (GGDEF)-like protein